MPLTLAPVGTARSIHHVGGSPELRRKLRDLGFTPGSDVTVLAILNGNLIVEIKDCRIALDQEVARRIAV